eukprot:TRINITY_DN2146_c0_g1_i12.p1 TRINITY_DN2146_c0_g1~~TRINITY_DN2146_c0_g1_i12.p1  ORF type:complete len:308 (-),score=66.09 TRINITY_DN2146_c0_g1_i12:117-992(-)
MAVSMSESMSENSKERTAPIQEPFPFDPLKEVDAPRIVPPFNPFGHIGILGNPLAMPPFELESLPAINPAPQGGMSGSLLMTGVKTLPETVPVEMKPPENLVPRGPREPKLENIVSTVNFDCKLDLRKIALHAKNAEYNPKRFAAVIMRIREPKTTALIFSSGKMVCTGAKSEADSETAARKYAKTIKKLGFDVKFKEFTIQNIVGSASVNFAINLEVLQNQHGKFCTFDPEIFPGLIYRMVQPKIVLLIFCSGKVVLTGAKKREQLTEAFAKIYPTLTFCQKKTFTSLVQ